MKTDNSAHEYFIRLKESESRMDTHEVRVSLETAKMLQQVGFDWECEYAILPTTEMGDKAYHYNHNGSHNYNNKEDYSFEIYSAPSLSVAQRWLREVKRIFISISSGLSEHMVYDCKVVDWRSGYNENYYVDDIFNTYEEAQEAGIKKCLTILLGEKK